MSSLFCEKCAGVSRHYCQLLLSGLEVSKAPAVLVTLPSLAVGLVQLSVAQCCQRLTGVADCQVRGPRTGAQVLGLQVTLPQTAVHVP